MGRGELCRVTSQSSRPCTLLTLLLTFPTLFFPYFSTSKSPKYFLRQPPSHLPISRSILPALPVLCFPLPLCAPQLKLSLFSGCHCRHPILPPRLFHPHYCTHPSLPSCPSHVSSLPWRNIKVLRTWAEAATVKAFQGCTLRGQSVGKRDSFACTHRPGRHHGVVLPVCKVPVSQGKNTR